MIIEYNSPNEVAFAQSNLGSYKVMAFSTKKADDQTDKSKVSIPKQEVVMQFIDNMVANLQCLGEEADPSILLLPGFCRLHKVIHSELECSSCQGAVAKVLTQIMEAKSDNTLKEEPMQDQDLVSIYESVGKVEEEVEDLNASYSDTSSYGGVLSSPPPGMIKIKWRRRYVKGQGWTSVVVRPIAQINKLIGEIKDKQEEHALPVSKSDNGKSISPPRERLKWIPKRQSFQAQVKEKLRTNKHKVRKPKEYPIWTLHFDGSRCKSGADTGIELVNPKGRSFYAAY